MLTGVGERGRGKVSVERVLVAPLVEDRESGFVLRRLEESEADAAGHRLDNGPFALELGQGGESVRGIDGEVDDGNKRGRSHGLHNAPNATLGLPSNGHL